MTVSTDTPSGDDALVDRAAAGDRRAFETIYRKFQGRIYGVCLRMTGNVAAAEDCTQAAFIRAWENLARFEKRSALGSWLHRIAVNEVLGQARQNKRRGAHLRLLAHAPDRPPSVARHRDGDGLDIEAAIAELPDGARHVFVLVGVYGYTHAEAAGQLGIAEGTCKAQLHRARQLMQTRLNANE